jgi:hypothetical protein
LVRVAPIVTALMAAALMAKSSCVPAAASMCASTPAASMTATTARSATTATATAAAAADARSWQRSGLCDGSRTDEQGSERQRDDKFPTSHVIDRSAATCKEPPRKLLPRCLSYDFQNLS